MTLRETMETALESTADPAWVLDEPHHDPLRESSVESRFAVSNGFLGLRGALCVNRGARWVVPPRTYVAGLFDAPSADRPTELVPAADWLQVRISLPDGPVRHSPVDMAAHHLTLDMRRGALHTECRHSHGGPLGFRLRTARLVSLGERSVGLQLIQLEIEDGEVDVTFVACLDGIDLGLEPVRREKDLGVWRTRRSGKSLAMAVAPTLSVDDLDLQSTAVGQFEWSWTWRSRPGQVVCFERLVAVTRSDTPSIDPGEGSRTALDAAQRLGWRGVVAEHEAAWVARWRKSDVEVGGDAEAQRALRFAIYHLNSAANPADDRVSIAARALTGDDYRGHVFWDTEIFLLPFYTMTWPEAARTLLMYRFRTLPGARAKAARMGWKGAFYAWESADTGAETTPEHAIGPDRKVVDILCGKQEQHISADIAYAVWQYWQATDDEGFLLEAGAEIILETGRFWSSRVEHEADGRHHIRGVIGPDEYHEHIDDNAFTNVMARWNIRRALDVAALLLERWPGRWRSLSQSLALEEAELARWRDVASTMEIGLDAETGLFEQFSGFFGLEQIALQDYAGRSVPMDVVLGRERTAHSQVIKQADVVALLGLLPEEFPEKAAAANFDFYEPRCSHGSSLSHAMHGLAAARLGRSETALPYLMRGAAIDLADTHVAIAGGVHIAALGGVWLTVVFGFAGLSLGTDGLSFDPKLPAGWTSLSFAVQWRGRSLKVRIEPAARLLEATLQAGNAMTLSVWGEGHEVRVGPTLRAFARSPTDGADHHPLDMAPAA